MRIEKINEKQIRCTLNQKDLKDREIGISELAYGTAKAKALFQDMMQQASYEFGFQTDDIPLMIEAIPLLPEALILVVTKVEDPDELDTRFSNFTEEKDWYEEDEEELIYNNVDIYDDNDDDMQLLDEQGDTASESVNTWRYTDENTESPFAIHSDEEKSYKQEDDFISLSEALGMEPRPKSTDVKKGHDVIMIYTFQNLDEVMQLAYHISDFYHGENTLYKDATTGTFYLVLHRSSHTSEEFGKICNILHEYGSIVKNSFSSQYYFEEHFVPIVESNAIKTLAGI